MSLDIEVRLLLNNLIRKHYDYFKVLEKSFSRYIVDQHKHYSEYPDEPPLYLISSLYELDRIIIDYCVFGAARVVNAHDACADMIKYKFWLYYNMHYSDYIDLCTFETPTCGLFISANATLPCAFEMRKGVDDRIIERFNKITDKCITILKLNDEVIEYRYNPVFDISNCIIKN